VALAFAAGAVGDAENGGYLFDCLEIIGGAPQRPVIEAERFILDVLAEGEKEAGAA
jgi:hypothetical protein